MKKLFLTTFLISSLATAAYAAEGIAVGKPDLKEAVAGTYLLEKSHANIIFSINHLGYSGYIGRFNAFDATLKFDPAAPEKSHIKVTVDPTSIDTNNAELEGKLKGDKFFNAAAFPAITFESTKITKTSDTTGTITGTLSMLGISKELTLAATFNGAGKNPFSGKPTLGFSATGSLKRSDFGLSEYLPAVGDEVKLTIETEFNQ